MCNKINVVESIAIYRLLSTEDFHELHWKTALSRKTLTHAEIFIQQLLLLNYFVIIIF